MFNTAFELAVVEKYLSHLSDVTGSQILLNTDQQAVYYLLTVHQPFPRKDL